MDMVKPSTTAWNSSRSAPSRVLGTLHVRNLLEFLRMDTSNRYVRATDYSDTWDHKAAAAAIPPDWPGDGLGDTILGGGYEINASPGSNLAPDYRIHYSRPFTGNGPDGERYWFWEVRVVNEGMGSIDVSAHATCARFE